MTSSRPHHAGAGHRALPAGGRAFLPKWLVFLVTIAIAKGLVALGLLLLMRTGLVSFGQGLYFAAGAYAAGVSASARHPRRRDPWCAAACSRPAAVAAGAGAAAGPLPRHLLRHARRWPSR